MNEEKYLDNKTFWKMLFRFLYAFFTVYAIVTVILNTFENKPFRFESFKTGQEAEEFLREKYIGRHVDEVKSDLSKVGVRYELMLVEDINGSHNLYHFHPNIPRDKGYNEMYFSALSGYYGNNWFSLDPLYGYYFEFF